MQKSSVNKVMIVGRLGQDPDGRFTPQGTAVSTLVSQQANLGVEMMAKSRKKQNGIAL